MGIAVRDGNGLSVGTVWGSMRLVEVARAPAVFTFGRRG